MWISNAQYISVKGFSESDQLGFSRGINIFTGPNNAGKSTLVKSLCTIQNRQTAIGDIIRKGHNLATIHFIVEEINRGVTFSSVSGQNIKDNPNFHINKGSLLRVDFNVGQEVTIRLQTQSGELHNLSPISNQAPFHLIVPYFSKRKVAGFSQTVNQDTERAIRDDLHFLVARIDDLTDPEHPNYEEFTGHCNNILGFNISAFTGQEGKQAGLRTDSYNNIPIESMGEGTAHILGLIAALCVSEYKIFLIEEIENDIHPTALKKLLELIIEKSKTNQFFISTHSHIVVQYLSTTEYSSLFNVTMKIGDDRLPISTCTLVPNAPEARREVLESLGYELSDYDLWEAWLLLEESSAEAIIRDHLIPWFIPSLKGKLKTVSAGGVNDVEPKFASFHRLFLFTHLTEVYKRRAWVIVDGDESGKKVVGEMQSKFSDWDNTHFRTLQRENFEFYYPARFQEEAKDALANQSQKRERKRELLQKVLVWTEQNPDQAREEWKESADEVIQILLEISGEIVRSRYT